MFAEWASSHETIPDVCNAKIKTFADRYMSSINGQQCLPQDVFRMFLSEAIYNIDNSSLYDTVNGLLESCSNKIDKPKFYELQNDFNKLAEFVNGSYEKIIVQESGAEGNPILLSPYKKYFWEEGYEPLCVRCEGIDELTGAEYVIWFKSMGSPLIFEIPLELIWEKGDIPQWEDGVWYEIHITDGLAYYREYRS